jgi:hypothetical protein
MNMKPLLSAALAASLLAAGIARADTPIYKWVDDKGQVHYSTEPHTDAARQLAIQNTATPHAGTDVTPIPGASTSPYASDATLVLPKPEDSPECKAGRNRLFQYLHAGTLYSVDEKGKKTNLSADDMKKALDDARAYVKQACGGGA